MPVSPSEYPETEAIADAVAPTPPGKSEAWRYATKQGEGPPGPDMSWKAAIKELVGENVSKAQDVMPRLTPMPPPMPSNPPSAAASCGSILARAGTYYRAPLSDLQLRAPIDQLYRQSGSQETMGNWVMRVPRPGDVAGCLKTDGTAR